MSRLLEHRMDNKNTKATLIKYVTNSKMAWFTNIHWLRKPIFQSKYLSALIYMYIHTTYKNTYIHVHTCTYLHTYICMRELIR